MKRILSNLAAAGVNLFRRGAFVPRVTGTPGDVRQGATVIPMHPDPAQPFGNIDAAAPHPATAARPVSARTPALATQEVHTLHDDPKLTAFREHDHYSSGYRDAIEAPNHEALEHGTTRLQTHFDNLIDQMQATRRARIGQAEMRLLDMGQQVSVLNEAKLAKFIQQTQGDIEELQRQRELAQEGKGWYREALANYRAGFLRGMGDSADVRRLVA